VDLANLQNTLPQLGKLMKTTSSAHTRLFGKFLEYVDALLMTCYKEAYKTGVECYAIQMNLKCHEISQASRSEIAPVGIL